jgi:hypothetical protein
MVSRSIPTSWSDESWAAIENPFPHKALLLKATVSKLEDDRPK